jgi:DNA polymerase-3 subunit alpha
MNAIEKDVRHGDSFQQMQNSNQNTLFGEASIEDTPDPVIADTEPWSLMEELRQEREVTGIYLSGHPLDDYRLEINTFVSSPLNKIDETKDRDLRVAGIVTAKNERVSRKGRKFCLFTVEDFTGAYQFALFGTQYLELGHQIQEGYCLLISGKRSLRYNSEEEYEFRISSVELLEKKKQMLLEGKETSIKRIVLRLTVDEITDMLIEEIEQLCKTHPGKYGLSLKIVDPEGKSSIDFTCRNFRISIDQELIDQLESMPEVSYKLN